MQSSVVCAGYAASTVEDLFSVGKSWGGILLKRAAACGISLLSSLTKFYRFKVEDEGTMSSTLLAWTCIRLDRLRQGFRFIPLRDVKGNRVEGSKLLVKVTKTLR